MKILPTVLLIFAASALQATMTDYRESANAVRGTITEYHGVVPAPSNGPTLMTVTGTVSPPTVAPAQKSKKAYFTVRQLLKAAPLGEDRTRLSLPKRVAEVAKELFEKAGQLVETVKEKTMQGITKVAWETAGRKLLS